MATCIARIWAICEQSRTRMMSRGLENLTLSSSAWRLHCCLCEHSSLLQGSPMLASMLKKTSHSYDSIHPWPWPPVFPCTPAPFYDNWPWSSPCARWIPSHALRFSSKVVILMIHSPTPPSLLCCIAQECCSTPGTVLITLLCIFVIPSRQEASCRQILLHSWPLTPCLAYDSSREKTSDLSSNLSLGLLWLLCTPTLYHSHMWHKGHYLFIWVHHP